MWKIEIGNVGEKNQDKRVQKYHKEEESSVIQYPIQS